MDNLHSLARTIAEAEEAVADLASVCNQAEDRKATIAGRADALAAERAAIAGRRAVGDTAPDDGARLALIAVDGELLATMLAEATGAVREARQHAHEAATALAQARNDYAAEEGRVGLAAVDEHATKLLSLLQDTLAIRAAIAAKLPPPDRAFDRVTARLSALDATLAAELLALRGTPFRRYGMQVTWHPSGALYDEIFKCRYGSGVFV